MTTCTERSDSSKYTVQHVNGRIWSRIKKSNGETEIFYPNGSIQSRGCYKHGNLEGKREVWHENGALWDLGFYVDGELEGERKVWYENGLLSASEFYRNGKREGERKTWYKNGQLQEQEWYRNGLIRCRIYYAEGSIEGELMELSYGRRNNISCRIFSIKNKHVIIDMKKQLCDQKSSIINSFIISDLKNTV